MARPRMTLLSEPSIAAAGIGISARLRRWWARWRRRRMAAVLDLGDHLRRDLGLPALAHRHGYTARELWWTGRPRW